MIQQKRKKKRQHADIIAFTECDRNTAVTGY